MAGLTGCSFLFLHGFTKRSENLKKQKKCLIMRPSIKMGKRKACNYVYCNVLSAFILLIMTHFTPLVQSKANILFHLLKELLLIFSEL